MVLGFLGGLIGRKPQAAPAASQLGANADILDTITVDLYMVEEDRAVVVLINASIRFLPEAVVFTGEAQPASETVSEVLQRGGVGDKFVFEFRYDAIEKFRQHLADMCQWSVNIDSSTVQDFGLVFPCESSLSKFHRQLVARICEVAFQEVASAPCTLAEYDRLAQQWRDIEKDAVAHIRERSTCSEAFILVTKLAEAPASHPEAVTTLGSPTRSETANLSCSAHGDSDVSRSEKVLKTKSLGGQVSGSTSAATGPRDSATSTIKRSLKGDSAPVSLEGKSDHTDVAHESNDANFMDLLICYIKVSHDEFLFPLAEQNEMQWWGASPEGEKRLFRIKFADASLLNKPLTEKEARFIEERKKMGKRFIDAYALTLAEVSTGSKLSADCDIEEQLGYADVFECANDDEEEGMHINDADSDPSDDEDQFPVVARDPTKEILRTRPHDMINHLLEPGNKRSVMFRVGGSDFGPELRRDMQLIRFDTEGHHSVVATVDGSKLSVGGKRFEPSSAMLHSCEEQLVILDENDGSCAYLMDLETEKVVAKLDTDGKKAEALLPTSAGSKSTPEPTFICVNKNSFFAVDTRMKGKARTQTYTYTGNQGLSCGATNQDGGIVLGSSKGVLRLYDGKTNQEGAYKRAKTQLNGLGEPILHMAVTRDGSWILATCATYLLLYPVRLASTGRTGFVTALGAQKPKPFVLKLDLADVSKYNLQNCSFRKAEFDEGEKHIVTATNNLVIVWDFVAVKNGKTNAYQVRPIGDYIKDLAVMRSGEGQTVVMVTPCTLTTRDVRRIDHKGA